MKLENEIEGQNFVLPGGLITTDQGYMAGRGTYTNKSGIYSALVGRTVITNKLISVKSLKPRFVASTGDVVIGKVVQIFNKKWIVEIEATDRASLHINSVTLEDIQRRKTEEDEQKMRELFAEGEFLVGEVRASSPDQGISLHIRNENFGKLTGGVIVNVKSYLIRRQKSHFYERGGLQMILSLNGFVWLSPKDKENIPPEMLQTIAKLRNIVVILNEGNLLIEPELLWEIFAQSSSFSAYDLLLPQNKEELKNIIKESAKFKKLK